MEIQKANSLLYYNVAQQILCAQCKLVATPTLSDTAEWLESNIPEWRNKGMPTEKEVKSAMRHTQQLENDITITQDTLLEEHTADRTETDDWVAKLDPKTIDALQQQITADKPRMRCVSESAAMAQVWSLGEDKVLEAPTWQMAYLSFAQGPLSGSAKTSSPIDQAMLDDSHYSSPFSSLPASPFKHSEEYESLKAMHAHGMQELLKSRSEASVLVAQANKNYQRKAHKVKLHCEFCFNNARYKWEAKGHPPLKATDEGPWRDHMCKTADGFVLCPVLAAHQCEICGATGPNAHTRRYCPVAKRRLLSC